jgi:hypothetical protein
LAAGAAGALDASGAGAAADGGGFEAHPAAPIKIPPTAAAIIAWLDFITYVLLVGLT